MKNEMTSGLQSTEGDVLSQFKNYQKELESKMFTLLTDSITVAKTEHLTTATEQYNEFQ